MNLNNILVLHKIVKTDHFIYHIKMTVKLGSCLARFYSNKTQSFSRNKRLEGGKIQSNG